MAYEFTRIMQIPTNVCSLELIVLTDKQIQSLMADYNHKGLDEIVYHERVINVIFKTNRNLQQQQ